MRRPGDRLRAFAARWCAPETMARLIDPLIADLQMEHGQAVRRGRVWKSRAIHAAGWIAFLKLLAICAWTDTTWLTQGWTADDRKALLSAVTFATAMIALAVMLLELPFVANTGVLQNPSPRRFVYLVPQAFSLALTIGVTLGVVLGLGGRAFSRRVVAAIVVAAGVASALSFVNLAWITPAANQAFRVVVSGQGDIRPGVSELSMGELSAEIEKLSHEPAVTELRYRLALGFQYHFRVALSFSPLIFVLFALAILSSGILRRRTLGMVACLGFLSYYMLLYGARAWVVGQTLPAYVAAWLPNAATMLVTVLLVGITLRRDSDHLRSH
jgi:hypothetical protein